MGSGWLGGAPAKAPRPVLPVQPQPGFVQKKVLRKGCSAPQWRRRHHGGRLRPAQTSQASTVCSSPSARNARSAKAGTCGPCSMSSLLSAAYGKCMQQPCMVSACRASASGWAASQPAGHALLHPASRACCEARSERNTVLSNQSQWHNCQLPACSLPGNRRLPPNTTWTEWASCPSRRLQSRYGQPQQGQSALHGIQMGGGMDRQWVVKTDHKQAAHCCE